VQVRPGARVSVDGLVVEGASALDESVLTGESIPVDRSVGDHVVAGAINTTGVLLVEAKVDGRGTTLARIARLVQESRASRADIQRLADRISAVFVPVVVSIAAFTLLGWWIAGDPAKGAIAMVTVLIIACPCALGLATPMAVVVATGHAAKRGILVRDAASLERAGRATRVVFDKTGTLTLGRPEVVSIEPVSGVGAIDLLQAAASVEQASEHPLAKAIVKAAQARGVRLSAVSGFVSMPGQGVRGAVAGRMVEVVRSTDASCEVRISGATVGTIDLADAPRPDAPQAISALGGLGLEVVMLSGDRRSRAVEIAERIGIAAANVVAETDPAGKSAFIESSPRGTVMVGDGVNDAAALTRADVGLALASGTSVAIESAGIVVPGDRVLAVPETIRIARMTLSAIRQNLFLAFAYNVSMIPIAALGLLGIHGPLIAAGAMALSDLSVVGNALRLRSRLRRAATQPEVAQASDA
jgi:Cu+-exporting ATPase